MKKPKHHHGLPELLDKVIVEIGTFYYYPRFIVAEQNEGVHITFEAGMPAVQRALEIYEKTPFGYIPNRINSYSMNPTDYYKLASLPNIGACAVVCYDQMTRNSAELERKLFAHKPFEIFDDLTMASTWMNTVLD